MIIKLHFIIFVIIYKGALLYEMMSGAPPFYSKDRNLMFKNILEVIYI
jgi:hypothetical protein